MPLSSYLDAALLHAQLTALSVIGTQPTVPGRTRLALSDADRLARDQLVSWMRAVPSRSPHETLGAKSTK